MWTPALGRKPLHHMIFADNEKFINYLEEEINKVLKRMKKNYSKMSINNIYVID